MFKNESQHIRRMLDSVAPYISYWVIQNNGSTDGTDQIVKQWAEETKIPGLLYDCEEGWVGFGWNRDHVLQKTLEQDHGCDWIMKMDCDETFEVDDDYDWAEFQLDVPSFHVIAVNGGLIYYRAWIWKAGLPWKFNHDPAHETIYINDGVTGENFHREGLPNKLRMRAGASYGESYSSPAKYVTDALMLEEKMIREASFRSDLYHFWYIGKSYYDCHRSSALTLPKQQNEFGERCIYYFESFIKLKIGRLHSDGIVDEMIYFAHNLIGQIYRSLGDHTKAIIHYNLSEDFCYKRNEHLVNLAELYWELRDYRRMHQITSRMVDPNRKMPFPEFYFIMHTELYQDTGKYVHTLHQIASQNLENDAEDVSLRVNVHRPKQRFWVVDNFYDDPHAVRSFAMKQEYENSSDWYKGRRTFKQFLSPNIKKRFEDIMGISIREWESHGMNGRFQFCIPEDRLVYHYDSQTWAAMVYLTPNAPPSTGTSFYAHKGTSIRHVDEHPESNSCFSGGFYDGTKFELVDTVGNVFNRLVIFDARLFHAASGYFGQTMEDSRLFQIFFFD